MASCLAGHVVDHGDVHRLIPGPAPVDLVPRRVALGAAGVRRRLDRRAGAGDRLELGGEHDPGVLTVVSAGAYEGFGGELHRFSFGEWDGSFGRAVVVSNGCDTNWCSGSAT